MSNSNTRSPHNVVLTTSIPCVSFEEPLIDRIMSFSFSTTIGPEPLAFHRLVRSISPLGIIATMTSGIDEGPHPE